MSACFADWTVRDAESAHLCQLFDWLCWNDSDGCYHAADRIAEGLPTLNWADAFGFVANQINNA